MKRSVIAAVAVVVALGAHAADITLKDGRVFQSATIKSQTPTQVTIAYPGGLTSVSKKLLPPDLAARYPIDTEAAAKLEAKLAAAKAARAEPKPTPATKNSDTTTPATSEPVGITEDYIRSAATILAKRYFQNDYFRQPHGRITSEVSLSEIRPIDGWTNRWMVRGTAVIRQYKIVPDGVSSFGPMPTPFPFIENDQTRQYSAKELRRMRNNEEQVSVETRAFEGTFSTEQAEPTLDVTFI